MKNLTKMNEYVLVAIIAFVIGVGSVCIYLNWNKADPVVTVPEVVSREVKRVQWRIEKANPELTEGYKQDEQSIAIDVTWSDGSTDRHDLGTSYGCTGSIIPSIKGTKRIFGTVNCYYALSGGGFVAYTEGDTFRVEKEVESAKDGSIQTTVLLEI